MVRYGVGIMQDGYGAWQQGIEENRPMIQFEVAMGELRIDCLCCFHASLARRSSAAPFAHVRQAASCFACSIFRFIIESTAQSFSGDTLLVILMRYGLARSLLPVVVSAFETVLQSELFREPEERCICRAMAGPIKRIAREDDEGSGKKTRQSSGAISEIARLEGNGSRGTRRRDGEGDFCFGIMSGEEDREELGVVGRVEFDSWSERENSVSSVDALLEYDTCLLCVRMLSGEHFCIVHVRI